jgi:ABC-2 type transport system permease protein
MITGLLSILSISKAYLRARLLESTRHWLTLISGLFYPMVKALILIFLLQAVFHSAAGQQLPVSLNQVMQYIALATLLNTIIGFNNAFQIAERVKSGNVVFDLLRPWPWVSMMFGEYLGAKLAAVLFPIAAFLAISVGLGITLPLASYLQLLAMIPGIMLLDFCLTFIIGIATLWTQNTWGLGLAFGWIQMLFSGAMVPLILLPERLKAIAYWTPFPYLIDAPVSVALGLETLGRTVQNQLLWSGALLCLGLILYRAIIKSLKVNGG